MLRRIEQLLLLLLVPSALFAQSKAVSIRVDSPTNNSVITTATLVVTGTVTAPSPNVRVAVNGIGAEIDLTHQGTKNDPYRWVATLIPPRGKVKIKARAFIPSDSTPDVDGPAHVRHVDFLPSSAALEVDATPAAGLVPLNVTFDVKTDTLGAITRFRADFDGNGTFEIDSSTIPQPVTYRYTAAGTFVAKFAVTRSTGEIRNGTATVVVNPMGSVDAALREIWTGFSDAMKAGDTATAMTFLAPSAQKEYGPILNVIQPTLGQFAAELKLEGPVWITSRAAHYLVTRIRNGETYGYHLYLARTSDGAWKIVKL